MTNNFQTYYDFQNRAALCFCTNASFDCLYETISHAEIVVLCNSYQIITNWNLPITQGLAGSSCSLGGKKHSYRMKIILFHWDFLLETLFLLSLGRDELEATHWSSSCSALSHIACAPHRTTLSLTKFVITCFTPSLTGKQEAFMRPWWELTVGKPYDKRLCKNSEL